MALQYDFEASIGYWVNLSSLAFRRALNEELAPLGITPQQSQVLGWLVLDGTLSQCELAARMEIEPPTLAGIIDRMETAGWVKRCHCPQDRRRKLIEVEAAAAPVWEKIAQAARNVRNRATAGLTPDQVEQLRSLLRTVHLNLGPRAAEHSRSAGPAGKPHCSAPTMTDSAAGSLTEDC